MLSTSNWYLILALLAAGCGGRKGGVSPEHIAMYECLVVAGGKPIGLEETSDVPAIVFFYSTTADGPTFGDLLIQSALADRWELVERMDSTFFRWRRRDGRTVREARVKRRGHSVRCGVVSVSPLDTQSFEETWEAEWASEQIWPLLEP